MLVSSLNRSWRWLLVGALRVTLPLLVALCTLHLGYLLALQQINPPPTPEQAADWPAVPIEVLDVVTPDISSSSWLGRANAPQLRVRLADRTQRVMEFPAPLAWRQRVTMPPDMALSADELERLPGCMGYARGQDLHGTASVQLPDELGGDTLQRFRIWELHCGPVHRRYEDFKAAYEALRAQDPVPAPWHWKVLALLVVAAIVVWLLPLRRWLLE